MRFCVAGQKATSRFLSSILLQLSGKYDNITFRQVWLLPLFDILHWFLLSSPFLEAIFFSSVELHQCLRYASTLTLTLRLIIQADHTTKLPHSLQGLFSLGTTPASEVQMRHNAALWCAHPHRVPCMTMVSLWWAETRLKGFLLKTCWRIIRKDVSWENKIHNGGCSDSNNLLF